MKIVKCKMESDKWGWYITPMFAYSNKDGEHNIWIGWLRWLFTVELRRTLRGGE